MTKCIEVNDLSSSHYSDSKNIRFKTSMLRSDLCDYSAACIVVNGRISFKGTSDASKQNRKLTFKNIAPFRSCIIKINNTLIENAEDLDIVMLVYNFLECSNNFFKTSGSLWDYYRDELNDSANETDNNDDMINNCNTKTSKF